MIYPSAAIQTSSGVTATLPNAIDMSDYDGKTLSELEVLLNKLETKVETLQGVNTENAHDVLIAQETKNIGLIEKAIVKLALRGDVKPTTTGTTTTTGKDYTAHSISVKISALPKFTGTGGAIEVNQFIDALDKIKKLLANDAKYEKCFLTYAKLQLDDVNVAEIEDAVTYEDFKKNIRKTFGGQLTTYQMLNTAWDVEYANPSDEFVVYGKAVTKAIRTAKTNILADHKERTGKDMTLDEYNDVISGMLMMDKLKKFHPEIFRSMVGNAATMNQLKHGVDVARQAETLRGRYQGDSLDGKKDESFYGGRYHSNQQKPDNQTRITMTYQEFQESQAKARKEGKDSGTQNEGNSRKRTGYRGRYPRGGRGRGHSSGRGAKQPRKSEQNGASKPEHKPEKKNESYVVQPTAAPTPAHVSLENLINDQSGFH